MREPAAAAALEPVRTAHGVNDEVLPPPCPELVYHVAQHPKRLALKILPRDRLANRRVSR